MIRSYWFQKKESIKKVRNNAKKQIKIPAFKVGINWIYQRKEEWGNEWSKKKLWVETSFVYNIQRAIGPNKINKSQRNIVIAKPRIKTEVVGKPFWNNKKKKKKKKRKERGWDDRKRRRGGVWRRKVTSTQYVKA